jgi:catechol 2,3-dioxygenase-like lactoylglutathione lyase family enzyme
MITGVDHTAISVPDMEAALAFYHGVLGFEVESDASWPRGSRDIDRVVGLENSAARVAMLRLGSTRLEMFEYRHPAPELQDPQRPVHHHGYTHFCLDVVDIQAEYDRLLAAGMQFNSEPVHLGSSIATYGRDPFGNVIELKENLPTPTAADGDEAG